MKRASLALAAFLTLAGIAVAGATEELKVSDIKEGAKGRPTFIDAKVRTVINTSWLLVGIEDARTGNGRYAKEVLVKCPTKGIKEGDFWRGGQWKEKAGSNVLVVKKARTVKLRGGGTRTLLVLEPKE